MKNYSISQRFLLTVIGLYGLVGVALGAMGAHALHDSLAARGMATAWETAVIYQLFHALALLGLAALRREEPGLRGAAAWTAWGWIFGVAAFSGSLYALALGGPRWLGPVTPLGGLGFLIGWVAFIVAARGPRPAAGA